MTLTTVTRRSNPRGSPTRTGLSTTRIQKARSSRGLRRTNASRLCRSASRFWMGVPVMAHRLVAVSALAASACCERGFLMLCASSSTTRSHCVRPSAPAPPGPSAASVPKVVTTTSCCARKAGSVMRPGPWKRYILSDPSVCSWICCSQFDRTDRGHTIRVALGPAAAGGDDVSPVASCAPAMTFPAAAPAPEAPLPAFFAFFAAGAAGTPATGAACSTGAGAPGRLVAMSAMTSSVLPSPMSSARMPPRHTSGRARVLWLERIFSYSPALCVQNGGKALVFSRRTIHASASF
mmetsp:Transcript_759/g.1770  ORF Transcript_759/g.1770 Transcript_759/m.1770 type:complete len:293 (-) Transcript_759:405-1283(-)